MKQAQGEVRRAIVERLRANLNISIYSALPKNIQYPHVEIGEINAVRWMHKNCPGQEHTVLLHFWDKFTGSDVILDKHINDASEAITDENSAVHNKLSLNGFGVNNQHIGTVLTIPNIDNTIIHKTLEITLRTKED